MNRVLLLALIGITGLIATTMVSLASSPTVQLNNPSASSSDQCGYVYQYEENNIVWNNITEVPSNLPNGYGIISGQGVMLCP